MQEPFSSLQTGAGRAALRLRLTGAPSTLCLPSLTQVRHHGVGELVVAHVCCGIGGLGCSQPKTRR